MFFPRAATGTFGFGNKKRMFLLGLFVSLSLVSLPFSSQACFETENVFRGGSLVISLGINSTFSQLDSDYCPPSTPVCVNFQSGNYVIEALNGYVSDQNVDPDCDTVTGNNSCGCRRNGICCSRGYQTTYLMNFPFNNPCNFGGDDPWYSCNADTDLCIRSSTLFSRGPCNSCSENSCQVCFCLFILFFLSFGF